MSETNDVLNKKMAELDAIVAWFDGEDFKLEEAMENFKKAEKLAEEIRTELAEFKNEIIILKQKFDQSAA